MKAYLITTGAFFGLCGVMQFLKVIYQWKSVAIDPEYFLDLAVSGVFFVAISVWAWRLLRGQRRH